MNILCERLISLGIRCARRGWEIVVGSAARAANMFKKDARLPNGFPIRNRHRYAALAAIVLVVSVVGFELHSYKYAYASSHTVTWSTNDNGNNDFATSPGGFLPNSAWSSSGTSTVEVPTSSIDLSSASTITLVTPATITDTEDFAGTYHFTNSTSTIVYNNELQAVDLTSGLVAYYTFDDADMVNNVTDTSGQGNNGDLVNFTATSSAVVPGVLGQALQFDGSQSQYVTASPPAAFNLATNASICGWVKRSTATDEVSFGQSEAGNDRFFVMLSANNDSIDPTGDIQFDAGDDYQYSISPLSGTAWHYVCMTYDGSLSGTAKVAGYVDGAPVSLTYPNGASPSNLPSNASLGNFIMGYDGVFGTYNTGTIDDVRAYSRTLSPTEVQELYNLGGGSGYSADLDTSAVPVFQAKITSNVDSAGSGSITYYLSNDGANWKSVCDSGCDATVGSYVTFADPSQKHLYYKVGLTGNATVSSFQVVYQPALSTARLDNLKIDGAGGQHADVQWVHLSWNIPSNVDLTKTAVSFRTRGVTDATGINGLYTAAWSATTTATTTGASGADIRANCSGACTGNESLFPTYRYLEIETILTSLDGVTAPTLSTVSATYAINAAPDFETNYPTNGDNGAASVQIATSSDPNWGKVEIDYAVRDIDTTSGTINPGCIAPSFAYRLNESASWTPIPSGDISVTEGTGGCGAGLQPVTESGYTDYSAYWSATSTLPDTYSPTMQIEVTANDNEIIYNIATTTTAESTLNTTPPVVSGSIDGSSATSTVSANISSDVDLQDYEISNNADFSPDGVNAASGSWQTFSLASTSQTLNLPWTLAGTSTDTVYFEARDIYGNLTSTSFVAPALPTTINISDLSNPAQGLYQLFIDWTPPYASQSGATFAHYDVWRSTDGVTFTPYITVPDAPVNYYVDTAVSSSTSYYYEVRTVDTDGDSSPFARTTSGVEPTGGGGTTVLPVISNVVIDQIKNTSARVTWTTNTLAQSEVDYGTSAGAYGSQTISPSYVLSHSVYLTDLTPNTTYYLQVISTDSYDNEGSDDNSGAGYSFTTEGGPVLSNVTVESITDNSATIFWNTDRPADSEVYYSTNADLSSPTEAGSDALVDTSTQSGVYSHSVALTGLSDATTYYFYVTSTDGDGNTTSADNSGGYYSFLTTRDVSPPVISNISTPVLTADSAVVVWSTDKPATSRVEYGTTASTSDGAYPFMTTLDPTLTVTHVQTLSDLDETTPYYFRVISADAAGNSAFSDEETFTTPATSSVTIETITVSSGSGSSGSSGTPKNTTPPTISSISVNPVGAFDATVNITGTPQFRAIVQYGETSSSSPSSTYDQSAGDSVLSTTKAIDLTGLQPGTMYHFIVNIIDGDGNITTSQDQEFTTLYPSEALAGSSLLTDAMDYSSKLMDIIFSALPSIQPPFISTPQVTDITQDSATVSWTTNVPSYSILSYATDADYQTNQQYTDQSSDLNATTTAHSISLSNLQTGTTYHFSAQSFVFPEIIGKSPDATFTTEEGPVGLQIIDVQPDSFRVLWETDKPTSSIVSYKDHTTGLTQTQTEDPLTSDHDITIDNLTPGTTYDVQVTGDDADGNPVSTQNNTQTVRTTVDTTPPVISDLKIDSTLVPSTGAVQSVVSWTTDKPADSLVSYDEGAAAPTAALTEKVQDASYVQNHVVQLLNLKPTTVYRIQVSSTDQSGNVATLPVSTFVTPQQSESIIDVIIKNFGTTFPFLNGQ